MRKALRHSSKDIVAVHPPHWAVEHTLSGILLRDAWNEQGNAECQHPEVSKEPSFSGTVTGWSICTTCGHRMPMGHSGAVDESIEANNETSAPLKDPSEGRGGS